MTVRTLTPIQLRSYLAANDWSLVSAPDEFIEVWRREGSAGSELLVPTEQAVDAASMIEDVVSRIAKLSQVTNDVIEHRIRELTENAISIRVIHPDVSDGSIPLEDGVSLNTNAKSLIAAAANATLERRPQFQGRLPAAVKSLLETARLGQTTHGSYVVHVFCPEVAETEVDTPSSFSSMMTATLQSALKGLYDAIERFEESGNPREFETAFAQGASANLCDAVTRFAGRDRARTVEISLTTGGVDQIIQPRRTSIFFTPEQQLSVRIAADYFRQTYTLPNEEVTGIVEGLERPADQQEGIIRIAAVLTNGAARTVSVQLNPDEYQTAIHAHENKLLVSVFGGIVVTPRKATMVDPVGFRVVGSLSLFD